MNVRVAFDTHTFIKRLEAGGVSVAHAEALADALGEIVLQSIAAKSDLGEVELSLRSEIKNLETSLRSEIKDLGTSLRSEMKELELRLTLRTGGMLAAAVAILAAMNFFT